MAYLIVRSPGQAPFVTELRGELIAGRDTASGLVLQDRQVSRRHLRLSAEGDAWQACDLGSTHGTRVNGAATTAPRALHDGDVVQIGGVTLVFRDGPAPRFGGPEAIVRTVTGVAEPPERATGEARRLRVLFDVGRIIGALAEPDRALEHVLDTTLEVLACERGMIGLVEAGAVVRRIARARGDTGLDELMITPAALAAIVERRESVLLRAPGGDTATAMGAPLDAAGRTRGFLYVDDRARGARFGADDLDFLTALGRLAAAALEQAEAHRRATAVAETVETGGVPPLLGESEPMRRLRAQIDRCAAAGDVVVLIHGETGTGKELVAAHLHARSPRADQPFVSVNCAAIPDNLVESELFGHARGAFTGAERARRGRFACAHRGTLFLDEIGDLGLAAQAKILRAIEEGEIQAVGSDAPIYVDVRIVAASHKDLAAEVVAGRFREDLYYRLDVLGLAVPPLRVRGDDVMLLAGHFRDVAASRLGRPRKPFTPAARAALAAYGWPGNVRQLQNEIERALLLGEAEHIDITDLRIGASSATAATAAATAATLAERFAHADRTVWDLAQEAMTRGAGDAAIAANLLGVTPSLLDRLLARDGDPTVLAADSPAPPATSWTPIEDAERQLIERALRANGGNVRATARALAVARATLYRKIAKYRLDHT